MRRRAPTSRAGLLLALPALGAMTACGLLARCGNDGDGAADAALDSPTPSDVRSADSQSLDAAVACNEASQGTRWTGWARVTEADPCCTVEVPDQVDAAVEPLTWIPCTNDAGACMEMPIDWGVQPNWTRFNGASVVAPYGTPTYAIVVKRLDVNTSEQAVYEFDGGASVSAWRVYGSVDTAWTANAVPAAQTTWVYVGGSRDVNAPGIGEIARAPTASALHPASSFALLPSTAVQGIQDFSASDTTLAFDIEPVGHIGRVAATATSTFVFSTGVSGLINPLVRGDDVFAKSNYGNVGWAEEYVVGMDGTPSVLRAKPNTQVDNFACDGTNLYWTEGYGGTVGDDNQPTQEVWSAPYTADPTTLATTAKKLADITGTGGTVIYPVAFNGYYAVSRGYNGATVVRASDGSSQHIVAGPGRQYGTLTYVSATELWAVMTDGKVAGVAFQRQTLPAWP